MLDSTLFHVSFTADTTSSNNRNVVVSGCKVNFSQNSSPYSQFDELNYYPVNWNDYGFGRAKINIYLENSFKDPYFNFFVNSFAIRTNEEEICKIYCNNKSITLLSNYTKLSKEGEIALGFSYYFKSQKEKQLLINCNSLLIESSIVIKNKYKYISKSKSFEVMCLIDKVDGQWQMIEGNTYKI